MVNRREDRAIHTDRPERGSATETLPTVREVIALDAVAQGVPEVLVGGDALEARVRWLHVSDSAGVARLLDGGELLLSTGSSWPAEPADLRRFIDELADAGLAGLVLELGAHYRYVPAVVAESAAERGLALIVLHREVKFVALTEAVHSRIIAGQTDALRARDEVRERFTALVLRGSPADFIVHQLAQTLGAPVILENLALRGRRGRGAAGARRGAVHRLGAPVPLRASPRRAAAGPGGGAGRRGMAGRAGRGARHPLGEPHRPARPGSSGGAHRGAGAGRDRTRGGAPRRRRRRRVGPHRTAEAARWAARGTLRRCRRCGGPSGGRGPAAVRARSCTGSSCPAPRYRPTPSRPRHGRCGDER